MKESLKYYRPYAGMVLLVVLFLFGQAMCELALPAYMSDIINKGIVPMDMAVVKQVGLLMIGIACLSSCCSVSGNFVAARVAAASARDIRKGLFHKVTYFSTAEMDRFSTASLITRSTNDVQTMQQTTVMMLRMAIFAPLMGVGALYRALRTSPSLSWTIALALLVILGIMLLVFLLVMPKFRLLQEKLDRVNQVVSERLEGLLVVRAFRSEYWEEERFDRTNRELRDMNIFVNRIMAAMFPALNLIMNAVGILIVWVGAKMAEAGELMIGDMLAFLQYSMHVIMSFLFITMMFIMIPRAAVSARRIGKVLETASQLKDAEAPLPLPEGAGEIRFSHVDFSYPDAEEKALDDVDFVAPAGKTTAVIGSTGSGKSTLIALLPRLYDVSAGSISIDGRDIRDISMKELRGALGYVPQKGLLFSGSIADNLRFGKEDATEEELRQAASTAQALDFIEAMPRGFATPVAQGGSSVSGGQKQRLAIARALLRDPKILIFDDSFSALDFRTDAALRKALKREAAGKTILVVAQRINTIMEADQILVMEEGRIVGRGRHEELMRDCRVYQEIARSQLSEEELRREGC